jgi:hypothetical protein
LKFGKRAKNIKNKPKVNVEKSYEDLKIEIQELSKENDNLKRELMSNPETTSHFDNIP